MQAAWRRLRHRELLFSGVREGLASRLMEATDTQAFEEALLFICLESLVLLGTAVALRDIILRAPHSEEEGRPAFLLPPSLRDAKP